MGKSSKDKRDAYYRLAKEQGWRARSAYKLLQLDEEFDLFSDVTRVVDLCAAPGSWSQVLSRILIKGEKFGLATWEDREGKLRQQMLQVYGLKPSDVKSETNLKHLGKTPQLKPREDVKIVAIDLQPMSPLDGIITLRADITHPATIPLLMKALDPSYSPSPISQFASNPVDLVLCDGAPDVTGLHDLDIYLQSQLLFAALNLTLCVLRPGGRFVAKIFRGRNVDLLYAQLKIFFQRVVVAKPRSSRASSIEAFIVCSNFQPPNGFTASLENPLGVGDRLNNLVTLGVQQKPVLAPTILQDPTNGTWSVVDATLVEIKEHQATEMFLCDDELEQKHSGRWIPPFLACGDLSAFDADASYHLPKDRVTLDPVQPPTAPPYKKALEMRKAAGGSYGKTSIKHNDFG